MPPVLYCHVRKVVAPDVCARSNFVECCGLSMFSPDLEEVTDTPQR